MDYKLNCIKCSTQYESNDPEPFYCAKCEIEKKAIAKEIDAKLAGRVSTKPTSFIQEYDAIRKAKGVNFVNIRDLGITLE